MLKKTKNKKRFITLIEMMVVIFLIGVIMSALGINFYGTLQKGKAFKTEASVERLETILNLAIAAEPDKLDSLESNWQDIVRKSPMVKDPDSMIKDGWGKEYQVTVEDGRIKIRSEKLEEYLRDHPSSIGSGGTKE